MSRACSSNLRQKVIGSGEETKDKSYASDFLEC